jgi:hypothetical protein
VRPALKKEVAGSLQEQDGRSQRQDGRSQREAAALVGSVASVLRFHSEASYGAPIKERRRIASSVRVVPTSSRGVNQL